MNLNKLRYVLLFVLAMLFLLLFSRWEARYGDAETSQVATKVSAVSAQGASVASVSYAPSLFKEEVKTEKQPLVSGGGAPITVSTDVLSLEIDTLGGSLVNAQLTQFPQKLKASAPVTLFSNDPDQFYIAQSSLMSDRLPKGDLTYTSSKNHYDLGKEDTLTVPLFWEDSQGLKLIKTYTFKRGQYLVGVDYQIVNKTSQNFEGRFYGQLLRRPVEESHNLLASYTTFTGVAMSTPDNHYQKHKFTQLSDNPIQTTAQGGFIAMLQHYFISAWIPDQTQSNRYFSQVTPNGIVGVGVANPSVWVTPMSQATTGSLLYLGPAEENTLKNVAPYLDLTIDYGWFWFLSIPMFSVMSFIHRFVGNWGISIILLTVLIKMCFYPLSAKSFRSMAKMRLLQPQVARLREQNKDDRQKLAMATMDLYRREKISPLSGCLPMLVQIPFFIALYWMLMESVALRQAPFLGWVQDLSARDPFFVLPILMGISMFIQQRLSPPPADPTQAKVMMFLPVVFTAMFLGFPAGLVLYWLVNNVLSILQQWFVMRQVAQSQPSRQT